MIYEFRNILTGLNEYVSTEEKANTKLAEIKETYIQQEFDRFSIAKVIADGDNSIWSNADLDNDPEEGNYNMFVHTTGQYELFEALSLAKVRRQELIDEFLGTYNWQTWKKVDKNPDLD